MQLQNKGAFIATNSCNPITFIIKTNEHLCFNNLKCVIHFYLTKILQTKKPKISCIHIHSKKDY
jgi:hypothetical protein